MTAVMVVIKELIKIIMMKVKNNGNRNAKNNYQ